MTNPTDDELDALVAQQTLAANKRDEFEALMNADRTVRAITALRAQLAEVSHMLALSKLTIEAVLGRAELAEAALAEIKQTLDAPDDWHPAYAVKALKQSNDRAEAALAVQIEVDAWIVQVFAKDHFADGMVLERAALHRAVKIIRNQPHDRSALDRMLRAEREKALRGAADWHEREATGAMNSLHCGSENSEYRAANRLHDIHKASAAAILAMIEQESN